MKSLSSLGIGLSLIFGCLFLALIAELYYLLWWKKRIANRELEDDYSSSARELFYLLCWRNPPSLSSTSLNPHNTVRLSDANAHEYDEQLHLHGNSRMDFLFKPFGEENMETELMRLHDLSGPPRFLFTIKEETKEDLESEDGKSRGDNKSRKGSRSRSLSDLLLTVETPYMTPLSSPPFFTPPLTPLNRYNQHGFNPLFESSGEAEMNRIRSSPPPKFKFLKDAEEKLYRKTLMEESMTLNSPPPPIVSSSSVVPGEKEGSFITILIGKNKEKEHHHSSSSVILPLSSSPPNTRPPYFRLEEKV